MQELGAFIARWRRVLRGWRKSSSASFALAHSSNVCRQAFSMRRQSSACDRAVGKVTRRTFLGRLRHARGIVDRAPDAFEARLRIVVIHPCGARRIGIARVLARFAIAGDAIEIAQVGDNAGAVGMLFGALHLADHLLPDRAFRATLGDEFLADGLGGTGSERARAPHGNSQIALTSQRRAVIAGEPDAFDR